MLDLPLWQEAGTLVRRNRHPDVLVHRLHLRVPRPLQGRPLQGSRSLVLVLLRAPSCQFSRWCYSQEVKAMVQDTVKSSLTQLGVTPQDTPTQTQSSNKDPEPPHIEDISSEGEISHSDQEDLHSGTPVLNQLLMAADEQADNDSLPSPVVTRAPLWKFAEQTPSGSQTMHKPATTRAEPVTQELVVTAAQYNMSGPDD